MKNMKKFIFVCLGLTLASIFFLLGWGIYQSVIDKTEVCAYDRFHTADSTHTRHFNYLGLLSPVQVESQKIIYDTMRFSHRVIYPLAPNFRVVPPIYGDDAENWIAEEIWQVIIDSTNKIITKHQLDYDGMSSAVRKSVRPDELYLDCPPKVNVSLIGTASPEAEKYGFFQSVAPGHFEKENAKLANDRLDRTAKILEEKGILIGKKVSFENQFPDLMTAWLSVDNKAMLDTMRYVQADVMIPTENLEIKTVTAPFLLPFWLAILGFLIGLSRVIKNPYKRSNRRFWFWVIDLLKEVLKLIRILFALVAIALGFSLIIFFAFFFFWWFFAIISAVIIYFIYKYRREIWEGLDLFILVILLLISFIFFYLLNFFEWFWEIIKRFLRWIKRIPAHIRKWFFFLRLRIKLWILNIIIFFQDASIWIYNWWHLKTKCQKILFFLFLYSLIVTVWLIYELATPC